MHISAFYEHFYSLWCVCVCACAPTEYQCYCTTACTENIEQKEEKNIHMHSHPSDKASHEIE